VRRPEFKPLYTKKRKASVLAIEKNLPNMKEIDTYVHYVNYNVVQCFRRINTKCCEHTEEAHSAQHREARVEEWGAFAMENSKTNFLCIPFSLYFSLNLKVTHQNLHYHKSF
jgi:hypothetical protein